MNGIIELLTNKHWMINPDYVQGIRQMLQHNLTTHAELALPEKVMGYPISADGSNRVLADYGQYHKVNEPFINFEIINGPITRNGDACSYGSRDHRDMMMMAADSPYCVGHIFSINTPGGSAWAKNDYQQAIDYAHSKGQRVIAFVDGMCCSAGMYLAALCDERYYMHPKNQIGCVGVMAAFYTAADGSHNQFTDETYHEVYATTSQFKNKTYRDLANDGNAEALIAELDALDAEFKADVKKACPNADITEHLSGKVFDAQDVEGILMDGQKNLAEVISLFDKDARAVASKLDTISSTNQNSSINMKEQFPAVFALLGVEEMQVSEEGTFFNKELLATLNGAIEAKNQEVADAKALADQLTAEKAEFENKLAERDAAIETLKAEHATAIEEKDNAISALEQEKADLIADQTAKAEQIETLNGQLTEKQTAIDTANATIAERDQQISDLNAQVEELSQEPGAGAQVAAPANNGAGAEQITIGVGRYVFNEDLSYEENCRLEAEWNKEHGK